MPSTQQFRKRIRSVKNTSQITRAMEMVASVKMQKAVKAILAARSYTQQSWNMLTRLAKMCKSTHPFLEKRDNIGRICLIVVSSDRGLCGSYNSDIMKKVAKYLAGSKVTGETGIDIVAVGKKGAEFVRKIGGNLIAEFPSFETDVEYSDAKTITKIALDGYTSKEYDQVVIIYSHFVSSLKQTPVTKQILPITEEHIDLPEVWAAEEAEETSEYKFEPDPDTVLERVIPVFLRTQIYGAFLEANASEYSAQMVAMKSATDNARDLISDLTLTYNSIRQDSITREIAEISGAAEAMK